jgi:hypothetical protein
MWGVVEDGRRQLRSVGEFYAAALSAFIVFAAMELFAGLAGLFLVVVLDHPRTRSPGPRCSPSLSAAVIAQPATMGWPLPSAREAIRSGVAGPTRMNSILTGSRAQFVGPGAILALHPTA